MRVYKTQSLKKIVSQKNIK